MVKSADNVSRSGSVPPFLKKCYEMVDDESTDSLISWSKSNDSFIISDMTEFSVRLLPKYFKHSNFSSFIRQLNIYVLSFDFILITWEGSNGNIPGPGSHDFLALLENMLYCGYGIVEGFRKTDTDRWEFANDDFVRGQKHLLKNICRRKHPHIADQQKPSQQQDDSDIPSQEIKKNYLWKEVENLKTDKNALMQELVKLGQHQESSKNKLLLLTDRLEGMETNQQQMLSFLVMAMQIPGFMVQLLQPKENNWRMTEAGNMLEHSIDDQPVPSDGMIMQYKPALSGKRKPLVSPSRASDEEPEPDVYADGLKDYVINSDFLKVLMDEPLCQIDNHPPLILPDSPDDNAWEQLLLDSPFWENAEKSYLESDSPTESERDIESTECETPNENSQNFVGLIPEMDKTQKRGLELCAYGKGVHLEEMESLESLTEQIELLVSEENET
ncbi:heat stress transcription factor A-8 [Senna tora]|uniref:Heat stress transcription factor A-8 n=1 Tax=Senna tora TaxID=362788 RepID=A0A834WLL5_9FABA|nr:heat stress transcription factor A-8 [Senna tora]